jgi:hypothetical protein
MHTTMGKLGGLVAVLAAFCLLAGYPAGTARAEEGKAGGEAAPEVVTDKLPAGARNFAGMVTGKILAKTDDRLIIEVTEITKTWKHSKAEDAKAMVGRKIAMVVKAETYSRKDGGTKYLGTVRQYFALVKVGDVDTFDVRHNEGDVLTFMELDKRQLKRLEGDKAK